MSKLKQCPFCEATTCIMDEPCKGCETFGEYLNTIKSQCADELEKIDKSDTPFEDMDNLIKKWRG